jgi:hypothetical protein
LNLVAPSKEESAMKLTLRIGAAIGIVALAACSQSGQDNAANMESDTQMSTNETVLPADEGGAESDTLGNQLNQLNESGSDTTNATENTTNSN